MNNSLNSAASVGEFCLPIRTKPPNNIHGRDFVKGYILAVSYSRFYRVSGFTLRETIIREPIRLGPYTKFHLPAASGSILPYVLWGVSGFLD
jgi:hypothetical protein